jgi:hypothetical protein
MIAVLAAVLAAATPGGVDETQFRWERELDAPPETRIAFEPDGPMVEHARLGLADLRVVDARGRQTPWRIREQQGDDRLVAAQVLNSGTEGGEAVALLDFGPERVVRDRIQLDVPARPFVGRAEVLGSDDRETFTRLSATSIYDVRGATRAVSTAVVFPPSDFRYYRVRASGVSEIRGATAVGSPAKARLVERQATVDVGQEERRTVVTATLPFRNIRVHELRFRTTTPAFDRPIDVEGSMDGESWFPAGGGRLYRFGGERLTSVPVHSRYRHLRITVDNGDDAPLAGLRVRLLGYRQLVELAPGGEPPYRVLYGARLSRPDYDFMTLPERGEPRRVVLGPERENPAWEPPGDTRSFVERHPRLLDAALAVAAAVVLGAGLLALRRRRPA